MTILQTYFNIWTSFHLSAQNEMHENHLICKKIISFPKQNSFIIYVVDGEEETLRQTAFYH